MTSLIHTEDQENGSIIIKIENGHVNILSTELLIELTNFIASTNAKGLIITGKESIFSAGLDFKQLAKPAKELKEYLHHFLNLTIQLNCYNKPLIFAINGHCAAGGTVLALTGDWRIMQNGNFLIGLNELEIGLPVPELIHLLMANCIGESRSFQSILFATKYTANQAHAINLVDELTVDALATAKQKMDSVLKLEPNAWQITKSNLKKNINDKLLLHIDEEIEKILKFTETEIFQNSIQKVLNKKK